MEERKGSLENKDGMGLLNSSVTAESPRSIEQNVQTEDDEKFHEMVSAQVRQAVKNFEWKLDSVRKERESVILILEQIVKEVFE